MLTAKNRDQLRDPTLGNRDWATFFYLLCCVTADDGSLRLVGADEISGRLEVYTEDEWKTVCSRQWTAVNTRYSFIYFLIFNIIGKGRKPLTCR